MPDPSLTSLRLGIFADWAPPSRASLVYAKKSGMVDIVLGVWADRGKTFAPRAWRQSRLIEIASLCYDLDLHPHLMVWAHRDKRFLGASLDWCREVGEKAWWIESLLLDCEGPWHRGGNGLPPQEAADFVAKRLDGWSWGVTGLPTLHKTLAPLAELAHYVVPQCYSFWKPTGRHWSHSKKTFPQTMQVDGVKSWSRKNSEIIMGLGCYWANRPAHQPYVPALSTPQTMRASAIETAALDIPIAWYWSLKWLRKRGVRGNEVRDFFGGGDLP